jgi:hypothetical protein
MESANSRFHLAVSRSSIGRETAQRGIYVRRGERIHASFGGFV